MVRVDTTPDLLLLDLPAEDQGRLAKSRLEIPLEHIRDIRVAPRFLDVKERAHLLPEDAAPDHVVAISLERAGRRLLYDVHDRRKVVVVDLEGEPFDELIIDVENPSQAVEEVARALAEHAERKRGGPLPEPPAP